MNYLKQRLNGHGGIILLDAQGRFGIAHNTPRMAWALHTVQKRRSRNSAQRLKMRASRGPLKFRRTEGARKSFRL